jgi:5-methylcytosine-specific restriction enzyme A
MPALRICATPRCPEPVKSGRCPSCKTAAEQARGSSSERGYGSAAHRRFRQQVLAREPVCVLCYRRPSVHADHHPVSRRDLVAAGANPNDPQHGRGLCRVCHSKETAVHQPGGWNRA